MAARIYREGFHSLSSESNGIQVGQWVFTGRPEVRFYNAEITHIENFTHGGMNQAGNPATIIGASADDVIDYVIESGSLDSWSPGDVLIIRGSTSGAAEAIARVNSVHRANPIDLGQGAHGTGGNRQIIATGHNLGIETGDYVDFGSQGLRRVASITEGTDGLGTDTTLIVYDAPLYGTGGTQSLTLAAEASITIQAVSGTLAGNITSENASIFEDAESFSFQDNGHNNGPLYLTGGANHYLIVPPGLEITANTLSA